MKKRYALGVTALLTNACWFPYSDLGQLPGDGTGAAPGSNAGSAGAPLGSGGLPGGAAGAPSGSGGVAGAPVASGGVAGAPVASGGVGGAMPPLSTEYTAVDVAVGWYHGCALLSGGEMYCWGSNYGGQLGDGTARSSARPVRVQGLSGTPLRIEADYTDSCAHMPDGSVQCWGSNLYGQLGNGSLSSAVTSPTRSLAFPVQQLSLGEYHTCALLVDGTIQCFGLGNSGRLGVGVGAAEKNPTPLLVPGISNAVQVGAGASGTCALSADGTVRCWGVSTGSDLCDGLNVEHVSSVLVEGLSSVTQISAGGSFMCARHSDGRVSCWGSNSYGQVGVAALGETPIDCTQHRGPAHLDELSDVVQVEAGTNHACALRATGEVYCWGLNQAGQLGDGTTVSRPEARPVLGITSAVKISAGYSQTCAVLADSHISCWGDVASGGVVAVPKPVPYILGF